jgi:uncharacterized membrane protein HdeD (DUF308 family)
MWLASRHTLVLRGLIAILFGLLLILWPGISLDVLVMLFGVFAVVDGSLSVTTAALAPREEPGRIGALIAGVVAVFAGLVTFLWPGLTQLAVLGLIAVRAAVIGVAEAATAVYLWRHDAGDPTVLWLLGGVGFLSISLAVLLLIFPAAALVAIVRALGIYSALVGGTLIAKAWMLTLWTETV